MSDVVLNEVNDAIRAEAVSLRSQFVKRMPSTLPPEEFVAIYRGILPDIKPEIDQIIHHKRAIQKMANVAGLAFVAAAAFTEQGFMAGAAILCVANDLGTTFRAGRKIQQIKTTAVLKPILKGDFNV